MGLIAFQQAVTADAAALSSNPVIVSVTITAPGTNTGDVYIGNSSGVSSSTGYILEKGESVTIPLRDGNTDAIYIVGTADDVVGVAGN